MVAVIVLGSKLPQDTRETWLVEKNAIEFTNWTWHESFLLHSADISKESWSTDHKPAKMMLRSNHASCPKQKNEWYQGHVVEKSSCSCQTHHLMWLAE